MQTGAELSPDRRYRYRLWRYWRPGPQPSIVHWLMLNPSTADESKDDATIRRCIRFSQSWGADGMDVYNLFAYRATDPKTLMSAFDPIGPENNRYLQSIGDGLIVAAWGSWGDLMQRSTKVSRLLKDRAIFCLGRCSNGEPKHPVRLAAATQLDIWRWELVA